MYRCATFLVIAASLIFAVGLVSGCGGSSRSVLYSGVSLDGGPKRVVTDAAAAHDVRAVHAQWLAEITRRAGEDPGQRCDQGAAAEGRRLGCPDFSYDGCQQHAGSAEQDRR